MAAVLEKARAGDLGGALSDLAPLLKDENSTTRQSATLPSAIASGMNNGSPNETRTNCERRRDGVSVRRCARAGSTSALVARYSSRSITRYVIPRAGTVTSTIPWP